VTPEAKYCSRTQGASSVGAQRFCSTALEECFSQAETLASGGVACVLHSPLPPKDYGIFLTEG